MMSRDARSTADAVLRRLGEVKAEAAALRLERDHLRTLLRQAMVELGVAVRHGIYDQGVYEALVAALGEDHG